MSQHKGTGFVQFRDPMAADRLIALSRQIEEKLDVECKEQRIKDRKAAKGAAAGTKGVTSVIQAELELNGRRLVVMEAMERTKQDSTTNATSSSTVKTVDDKKKLDKRNLVLKREGLLNFDDWIHKKPQPTEKVIATR